MGHALIRIRTSLACRHDFFYGQLPRGSRSTSPCSHRRPHPDSGRRSTLDNSICSTSESCAPAGESCSRIWSRVKFSITAPASRSPRANPRGTNSLLVGQRICRVHWLFHLDMIGNLAWSFQEMISLKLALSCPGTRYSRYLFPSSAQMCVDCRAFLSDRCHVFRCVTSHTQCLQQSILIRFRIPMPSVLGMRISVPIVGYSHLTPDRQYSTHQIPHRQHPPLRVSH